jgi:hypothetical protein
MADESDVGNVLAGLAAGVVYPGGTSAPSIVGAPVLIYRGWPKSAQLDGDLAAGKAHVSIFAPPGMERNTTRYRRDDIQVAPPVHTLTATVSGNTVTIGGTVAVPQNIIVLCGIRLIFPYAVQAGDTLASIAANLAALLNAAFPGTVAVGATVTIAGRPGRIQARVASQALVWTEQGRQEKSFWLSCWCPTPAMRDVLAPAIDLALRQRDFITMPDQGAARLIYGSSRTSDEGQKVQIYRRDLIYSVEYATATVTSAPEIGAIGLGLQGGAGPATTINI